MIEIIRNPKIDFMKVRKVAFGISLVLALLGVFALVQVWRGTANLGIDFAGGTSVQIQFDEKVELSRVRGVVEGAGIEGADLQDLPTERKVLVRVKKEHETLGNVSEKIIGAIETELGQYGPVVDSTTEIGPKVGEKLRNDAIIAIIFATAGILIYVAARFQFRFAVGATIATFHDVLAVLGFFHLMNKEINLVLVSALLMIAGYSLTDTVVVFDRVRENLRKYVRETIEQLVNRSINEVLSRTVIVSLTTLLAALSLYLFGGEVIHDFSLAILLGVVVGNYSSIFVASPIVLLMGGDKALAKR